MNKTESRRRNLPHHSIVKTETISIPVDIDGYDERGRPMFSQETFKKKYKNGVCIGWK